jgi:ribonucleoside-triphosphate reductase
LDYVIKRDGNKVPFEKQKIISAILKTGLEDESVANKIADEIDKIGEEITVQKIHELVEHKLMATKYKDYASEYVRYHQRKDWIHENEKTNDSILKLIEHKNTYIDEENSNKNASIASTQRDYMAGEVSKNLAEKLLLPPDIVEAHNAGIIHFHDEDYFLQRIINCCLVNLEDMLQNGTVINGTLVEKPHSFSTACNIATQIMAQVASNQYGGQTESLSALAPFVDISRQKIKNDVEEELSGLSVSDERKSEIVERRLRDEIKRGVQTIQYQINTLMTTNGQTPFVSLCMYLDEVEEGQTRDDLAMIIEEVINQRYQGTKNEKGVWITPAFPKLLYVLSEDNIHEDSKYYYLTKLAAKCTAKRLVPDYISEKIMKQNKIDENGNGNCYPCMGCRSFLTPYIDENGIPKYYGRLTS